MKKVDIQKLIANALVLSLVLGIHSYIDIQANGNLQSQGKLVYYNEATDEEVIIDTADHEILNNRIDSNESSIQQLTESTNIKNAEQDAEIVNLKDDLTFKNVEIPCEYTEYIIYAAKYGKLVTLSFNMQAAKEITWDTILAVVPDKIKPNRAYFGNININGTGNNGTCYIDTDGKLVVQPSETIDIEDWFMIDITWFTN